MAARKVFSATDSLLLWKSVLERFSKLYIFCSIWLPGEEETSLLGILKIKAPPSQLGHHIGTACEDPYYTSHSRLIDSFQSIQVEDVDRILWRMSAVRILWRMSAVYLTIAWCGLLDLPRRSK